MTGKMLSFQLILIGVFCALSDSPYSHPAGETICISGSVSERQGKKPQSYREPKYFTEIVGIRITVK